MTTNKDEEGTDAQQLAAALRRRRNPKRWRAQVERAEAGEALDAVGPVERAAIHIQGGAIHMGPESVSWYSNHLDDVLVAFLELVRRLRGEPEVEVTGFRRVDIDVLAHHLGMTGEEVLHELALLLGATDARSASMAHLYKSGINIIPTGAEEEERPTEPQTRLAELLQDPR